MRVTGTRFECLRMRPHDHLGWVFAGPAGFAALAAPFLAEGAARGEKLMCVTGEPGPAALARLTAVTCLPAVQVASIAEVYGASGIVDAARQRAVFAAGLAQAHAQGFTGLRVAADNTPLVADEARLRAWIRWEIAADRFMAEHQVTGLCAFDGNLVDVDRLRHLATLHPLSSAASPVPQFRLFSDGGRLCIEGHVDSFALSQLLLALTTLPGGTSVLIDLRTATLHGGNALATLARLASSRADVTIQGDPAGLTRLRESGLAASQRLTLRPLAPA